MTDEAQNPTHAQVPAKQRKEHRFALYDPASKTTFLPFIITRHKAGELVTAVVKPKLQMSQGHIVPLPLGEYDKKFKQKLPIWITTADGFRMANTFAGWTITFPQQVYIPGLGLQANPYIETDRSGAFVRGFARAIGIGRSALTGDLMIIDRPTHISVQSYIEEDLAGKAKFHPTSIVWGSKDMNPLDAVRDAVARRNLEVQAMIEERKSKDWGLGDLPNQIVHEEAIELAETQRQRGLWKFFPIIGNDVGIWVNMASNVVTDIFRTLVQKRKFGSRLLPAIAERNVLRTALGFYRAPEGAVQEIWPDPDNKDGTYRNPPKVLDAVFRPSITVHRMEFDSRQLDEMRRNYLAGVQGGLLKHVEVDKAFEEASGENLLLVEPDGGAVDTKSGGEGYVALEGPMADEVHEEMDDRERLLVEIGKHQSLVEMSTADEIRQVIFDDPVLVDLKTEPLDKLRSYLAKLKAAITNKATTPVQDDPSILGNEEEPKEGDG